MKSLYLIIALCWSSLLLTAQNETSWKQHVKLADKLYKAGNFGDAAHHYQKAWKQKTSKKELIRKAGECYFKIKEYRKAADAYKYVKDDSEDPLTGLRYGRCLKQAGAYAEASQALIYFLNAYQETDKPTVSAIVQNEIRGCELALKLQETDQDNPFELIHLNENVNTNEAEFAPVPFSDDIIYFSSTMEGKSRIYRSQLIDGVWSKAVSPESFPRIDERHFCNGSFTPDSRKFYFTLCEDIVGFGSKNDHCAIYVTRRQETGWSEPEKLRAYVNMPETSNAHPFVFHKNDKEYLFFSSNRKGGKGGADIWYMSRRTDSEEMDFTLPRNAGGINTIGDEITPFFDVDTDLLYFSSNGKVSVGGFDIFSARAKGMNFSAVKNLGYPYNSSADDYFYIKTKSGSQGFLASNRLHGNQKISTGHDDIFTVLEANNELNISGNILDGSGAVLAGVSLELYEIDVAGREKLLHTKVSDNGQYFFNLVPGKEYQIIAYKPGYNEALLKFEPGGQNFVYDFNLEKAGQDIVKPDPVYHKPELEKVKVISITTPVPVNDPVVRESSVESVNATTPASVKPDLATRHTVPPVIREESVTYTPVGEQFSVTSSAPRRNGKIYKVQIIAVKYFDINQKRYQYVRSLGRLDTEKINGRGLVRVLLADFYSREEARQLMTEIRQYREFENAFIVKYIDGKRIGNSL